MTAIKKTTAKATKSPAPATKTAKPATKPAAAKASAKKTNSPTAAIMAAVARAATPELMETSATAAGVKPAAAKTVTTTITAKIDVGFGNTLYVRGEGAGLSWDRGLLMNCVGADLWRIELGDSVRPIAFKLLLNDTTWSTGADYSVAPGARATVTPQF